MDPTASKDNNQNNAQSYQADQENPIQPGQFVVSGEPGAQPQPDQPSNPIPDNTQATVPKGDPLQPTPNPEPATSDLERDLKETLVQATVSGADRSVQGKPSQSMPSEAPPVPPEPEQVAVQPDPTPFVHPQESAFQSDPSTGVPNGGVQPQPQQQNMNSGSKMGKIIPVAVGVVVLVAIIAAVSWFFILNRKSNESTRTQDQLQQIEAPASPSPAGGRGFGEIEESPSPIVSPDLTEGSVEPTLPPAQNPPPGLTTQ